MTLEERARAAAASRMGLVKDPLGLNLPEDLWQQALCRDCHEDLRDFPSTCCVGCDAYRDHQK